MPPYQQTEELVPQTQVMSQVADIRITKAGWRWSGFTGAAAAKSRRYGGRLEESKVIMGNCLSHLEHLAGSYP